MKFIILLFLFLSSVLLCKFTCGKIKNQIKRNALKHNINYYESNYNHKHNSFLPRYYTTGPLENYNGSRKYIDYNKYLSNRHYYPQHSIIKKTNISN